MPQLVPLIVSTFNYRFGTALDGVQYVLDVRWNGRDEAWYMDVSDEEGNIIRSGLKLVLGANIGGRIADADFPAGDFLMSDLANEGRDATFDDITERVALYFFSENE